MKPQTLIDAVYRASFRPETNFGWKSNTAMKHALESARRFVVDDSMAAFMADLSNAAFLHEKRPSNGLLYRVLDSLRVSARLPHEAIWIEYPLHAYQTRSHALRIGPPPHLNEIPTREGWLIQQHPHIETAHIMHLFTSGDPDELGFTMWTFPFAFGWCCDDAPLPWWPVMDADKLIPSALFVGVQGYDRKNVNIVKSPLIHVPARADEETWAELLVEWAGVIRRVWALLSTIDNIPMTQTETRVAKGFLARGQIRKYLSHRTITLNVPARASTKVLARKLIAVAHRKRHPVRAHWRDDWRHPPSPHCKPHLWQIIDEDADRIECSVCHGRQSYIHKHERGNAALGYVTTDYKVVHED
jgi:hypothetical protein